MSDMEETNIMNFVKIEDESVEGDYLRPFTTNEVSRI